MNIFEPLPYIGVWTPGTRKPAVCGTDGGYYRHRRLWSPPCEACRKAHTNAENARNRRRSRRRIGVLN